MNKKILVPGYSVGENSFGIGKTYVEYLSQFGDIIISAPTVGNYDDIDLVVLPGGSDLSSGRYNQVPSVLNSHPDLFKEFFFDNNLPGYIEAKVPVYGICLGAQMLHVWSGGELDQHCGHPYSDSENRAELAHEVDFGPKYGYLFKFLGLPKEVKNKGVTKYDSKFKVNSHHHQGIPLDSLQEGFEPVLIGPYDIVEAFMHTSLPIAGYQGHPEDSYCKVSEHLIKLLLERGAEIKHQKKLQKLNKVVESEENKS